MNGDKASIDEICSWLLAGPLNSKTEGVVGVPGCYLQYVSDKVAGSAVSVAAQNCYKAAKGAFTGTYRNVIDVLLAYVNPQVNCLLP